MQTCPDCGLISPEEARRCDCGFDLSKGVQLQPGQVPRMRDLTVPFGIAMIHALLTLVGVATVEAEGSILPWTPLKVAVILALLSAPAVWLFVFLRFVERRPMREAAGAPLTLLAFPLVFLLRLLPVSLVIGVLLLLHAGFLAGLRWYRPGRFSRFAGIVASIELVLALALFVRSIYRSLA